MARRYINTSQFNPYIFPELWQPAEAATQAHMQQAATFAELGANAAMLGDFIDPERDPEEYRAWDEYTQNLRRGSEALMRNGLSGTTFNSLWQSSVDYGAKIKPIETAVGNKQKFAQMLNQTALQHPNTLFIKDPNDYALRDYKAGIPQPEIIDIDAVQKEAELLGKIYANDKVRYMQPQQYDRYRQMIIQKYGDSFDEAMQNISDSNQRLYQIKQMLMEAIGANRLLDNGKQRGYNRLDRAVDEALIAGAVGQTKADLDTTKAQMDLQWAKFNWDKQMDVARMTAASQSAKQAEEEEQSKWLNSLSWHRASGSNSARVYGWATAAAGRQAREWQSIVYGNATADGSKFKVKNMKGKEVTISQPDGSVDGDRFAITFEGPRNEKEFNLDSTPYYLMQWNGETYRVSPDALGLPQNMVEEINYIFGSPSKAVRPDLEGARSLVTEYRRDPYNFAKDQTRYIQDPTTGMWMVNPYNDGRGVTKNEQLESIINGYTIAVEKSLFATAKATTTTYKVE